MTVEWPIVPLEPNVAVVVRGVTYSRSDATNQPGEGRVPLLRAGNIGNGELDVENDLVWVPAEAVSAKQMLQPSDIVVCTSSGSPAVVGKAAILRGDFCGTFGAFNAVIRAHDPITAKFLHHWFQSPAYYSWRDSQAKGANIQNIRHSELAALRVPLPTLSEQRRLVEILDQADHLRRLRTEANTKAARILPALFLKMFGDPATNPMGWPSANVADVGEVQGGLQLSRKRESNPLQVPYLRVANVYRERLDLREIKNLGVTQAELERTRLAGGDILVVEGHGNKSEIGRCAVWDGSIDPCVHQNHLIRLRADRSRVVPSFISAYLNSSAGRQQLLKAGKTTSGLNTISVGNVKKARIYLPPLDRQEQFDRALSSSAVLGRQAAASSERLHVLWSQLLSLGFSGDLTQSWREPRMEELQREMELQAAAMAECIS